MSSYANCHYAECYYAECHYAVCHYAECHYAECHYADCHCDECCRSNCRLLSRANHYQDNIYYGVQVTIFKHRKSLEGKEKVGERQNGERKKIE